MVYFLELNSNNNNIKTAMTMKQLNTLMFLISALMQNKQ